MRVENGILSVSATDLANFTACRHLTRLELAAAHRLVRRPHRSTVHTDAIAERGAAHEAAVHAEFTARGWNVVDLRHVAASERAAATEAAMRSGVDAIYQGQLRAGTALGLPDFLVRTDLLGAGEGYEVVDAKLARSAKALAVLQCAVYSRLLHEISGIEPRRLHLALGNGEVVPFRVASFAAYERRVAAMFDDFLAVPAEFPPHDTYPDPTEHCVTCRWSTTCSGRRRADDDLSLVAGITAHQRTALRRAAISTRRGLANRPPGLPVENLTSATVERLRRQAYLQVLADDQGRPLWEFIEPERGHDESLAADRGLLALPEPVDGDLFFDIESARHYSEDGREFGLQYLFGVLDTADLDNSGAPRYHAFWALNRTEEKRAFEDAVDFMSDRVTKRPGAHIYHYNHYEPTTLGHLTTMHATREETIGRLTGRFGTREAAVDAMLRGNVLVDLYRVVRQGILASVESYSLKRLEPLCGFHRTVPLDELNPAMITFEQAIDSGTASVTSAGAATVRGYNEDDCRATLALRDWLESRRRDLAAQCAEPLPRPTVAEITADAEDSDVARLRVELIDGLPEDRSQWSRRDAARALVSDLLEYHRREDKPMWWRYFHLRRLTAQQLCDEREALGGLVHRRQVGTIRRSTLHAYGFPPQEHGLSAGDRVEDPATGRSFTVHEIDDAAGEIILASGSTAGARPQPLPSAVVAKPAHFDKRDHANALREIAGTLIRDANPGPGAALDLLLRRPPHVWGLRSPQLQVDNSHVDLAVDYARRLTFSHLPIQGPPGTGKTHASAHQVLALVDAGRTVGITATSHAVIRNLVDRVAGEAARVGVAVRIGQKVTESRWLHPAAVELPNNAAIADALRRRAVDVVAATSWTWTRPAMRDSLDTLVVDEAGQMCLADVLACSLAARNLIMLGDPMQLAQPSKGSHPPGAGTSGMGHVLDGSLTMPPDRGLFLGTTRRMHPHITSFTSRAYYEDRLHGLPRLERQEILDAGPFSGSGLRYVDVEHSGNSNASPEEAAAVVAAVETLLRGTWRDADDLTHSVTPDDILIVTPFNAQIREIELASESRGLPPLRVGTVDRFQGGEAPIAIYSMATSTAAEAPRGMEFLYDPHRLNVATSRARCVAIVVSNPELTRVFCHTPRQMELANGLCLLREMAAHA